MPTAQFAAEGYTNPHSDRLFRFEIVAPMYFRHPRAGGDPSPLKVGLMGLRLCGDDDFVWGAGVHGGSLHAGKSRFAGRSRAPKVTQVHATTGLLRSRTKVCRGWCFAAEGYTSPRNDQLCHVRDGRQAVGSAKGHMKFRLLHTHQNASAPMARGQMTPLLRIELFDQQ